MELYVHIPFCARKCAYCDFLSFADRNDCMERYPDALIRDVNGDGGLTLTDRTVTSIFIGGGTPSRMPLGTYERLLGAVREHFSVNEDAEITIECNPGTVDAAKLAEYRSAGINRISFGVQSADNAELRELGRIHTWEEAKQSFCLAREASFDNISIDLMMNLPGQTTETFARTLREAIALSPEHISAYSLILEEGTAFYERYAERPELLPSDEEAAATYEAAVAILGEAGYLQYEISNFAKPGRECRHNIGYWKRAEYLGIGIGAASLIGERRYRVEPDLDRYLKKLTYEPCENLDEQDVRNETMMLGLRMNEGLSISELRENFGEAYTEQLLGKLQRYVEQGLATVTPERIALTVKGMLVSNTILSDLME
ncbi:MAG: radical SAM family heme chaperone HemW [Lachnospiraceae bacterium]|nr:radical SAM family heme chaperone HemW [Lachnospiraceae bacterium]